MPKQTTTQIDPNDKTLIGTDAYNLVQNARAGFLSGHVTRAYLFTLRVQLVGWLELVDAKLQAFDEDERNRTRVRSLTPPSEAWYDRAR